MNAIGVPSAGVPPCDQNGAEGKAWRGGVLAAMRDPWVMAALAAAMLLRLFRLGDAPLWFDETITADWVRLSWPALLREVLRDNHPPLYFVLLKAWAILAGESAAALRLPSVIASAACVPVIAAAGGIAGGRQALRWAAWMAAIAPLLIHHGQEARSYTLVGLFASLQFLMVLRFLHRDVAHLSWSYAAVGALLGWTHYYGAGLVFVLTSVLLLTEAGRWRLWIVPATAACVAAGVAVLPATLLAYHHTGGGYEFGIVAIAGVLWGLFTAYALAPSSAELHMLGASAALRFAPIALLCALCAVAAGVCGLRRLAWHTRIATLLTIGAVVLGPYAATLVADVGMHPRYALPALAPLIVILAAAASTPDYRQMARGVLGVILLIMTVATARHLGDPAHGREQVDHAGRWIDENVPRHEQILVTSNEMAQLAQFHWPERRMRVYPDARAVVTEANVERIAVELPMSVSGRTYYVIGREWVSDPHHILEAELMRHYTLCGSTVVRGIRILCLRPPGQSHRSPTRMAATQPE